MHRQLQLKACRAARCLWLRVPRAGLRIPRSGRRRGPILSALAAGQALPPLSQDCQRGCARHQLGHPQPPRHAAAKVQGQPHEGQSCQPHRVGRHRGGGQQRAMLTPVRDAQDQQRQGDGQGGGRHSAAGCGGERDDEASASTGCCQAEQGRCADDGHLPGLLAFGAAPTTASGQGCRVPLRVPGVGQVDNKDRLRDQEEERNDISCNADNAHDCVRDEE
mmetsp:Transcript_20082/g.41667  ORF Transcript_20082/g.41667 Transcript_20082/m.41667 type:complete len:220 (-) Transcript_20082:421-1080(-)